MGFHQQSADEELENSLAGINISDDDNHSDMSLDQSRVIADAVISIECSAAAMDRAALKNRVIQLETQLLLARTVAPTNRNQALHNKILHDATAMATAIMGMDLYTLWWLIHWIEERKAGIAAADIAGNVGRARRLRSYKEWVYKNRMKAEAGMTHAGNNTAPTTPE
jgi:hypothetical protein